MSEVRCRFANGSAVLTAIHCLLLQEMQVGFTFLVLAQPGSPRQNSKSRKTVVLIIVVVWRIGEKIIRSALCFFTKEVHSDMFLQLGWLFVCIIL